MPFSIKCAHKLKHRGHRLTYTLLRVCNIWVYDYGIQSKRLDTF